MQEYFTVKEIMGILKISRTSAYGYIKSGRLKSFRVGKLVRIPADDLQQFIEGKPSKRRQR